MRRTALVVVSVLLAVSLIVPGANGTEIDLNKLQGPWIQVYKERNGERLDVKNAILTFTSEKFETVVDGKPVESGDIGLDPAEQPKKYSVTITGEFEDQGKIYNGIYQLEGDTLITCVSINPGQEPPTQFISKPETGHQLVVWIRQKP